MPDKDFADDKLLERIAKEQKITLNQVKQIYTDTIKCTADSEICAKTELDLRTVNNVRVSIDLICGFYKRRPRPGKFG